MPTESTPTESDVFRFTITEEFSFSFYLSTYNNLVETYLETVTSLSYKIERVQQSIWHSNWFAARMWIEKGVLFQKNVYFLYSICESVDGRQRKLHEKFGESNHRK